MVFSVPFLLPGRTFWQKNFLINEKFDMKRVLFTHSSVLFRQDLHEKEGVQ